MKTRKTPTWTAVTTLLTVAAAALSLHPAAAQKTRAEAEKPQDPKNYTALLPGEHHKPLGQFVGDWDATLRVWGHGTPPPETSMRQTLHVRWVMRDNWVQTDYTHKYATVDRPSHGVVYRGYNGATESYVAIILDDGDTRETVSKGTYDAAKKTFVFEGPEKDPYLKDTFTRKETYTFVDNDHYNYTLIYVFQDGSDIKAMEGTFTRVKEKK
jgi:hypothetical protein